MNDDLKEVLLFGGLFLLVILISGYVGYRQYQACMAIFHSMWYCI